MSIINSNVVEWNDTGTKGYKFSPNGGVTFTLFLPAAGLRNGNGGSLVWFNDTGCYWPSFTSNAGGANYIYSNTADFFDYNNSRTNGYSVRCIKEY
jgi:hypothetical protein